MKLELINELQLKIVLEKRDLEHYGLRYSLFDYDREEVQYAFKDVLKFARDETGFDTSGYRIFVEVFPEKEGGCALTVTKICEIDDYFFDASPADHDRREKKMRFYSFKTLGDLTGALVKLEDLFWETSASVRIIKVDGVYILAMVPSFAKTPRGRLTRALAEYAEFTDAGKESLLLLIERGTELPFVDMLAFAGSERPRENRTGAWSDAIDRI